MSKTSRSSIVGFHNIKNKVSRNAFDLSHRHLFTAQVGELLPIFVQWVNPNESFKIGYNGFSRTQPLQTAAFTRLRENVQYYFVPFQSLWKYFEQQINNMTTGQSGENISRIAKSATEDTEITTSMPFINVSSIKTMFDLHFDSTQQGATPGTIFYCLKTNYIDKKARPSSILAVLHLLESNGFAKNGVFYYASTAKLLRALGYYNGDADNYDIASSFYAWAKSVSDSDYTIQKFRDSDYGITFNYVNHCNTVNAPNLSIFPLLAYQKIVNDHYLYRQWQPYKSYACNIDYLQPTDSMNFMSKLGNNPLNAELFRMQYSNLPLDYFNGVLPKAQYGEESAVSVTASSSSQSVTTTDMFPMSSQFDTITSSKKGVLESDANGRLVVSDGSGSSSAKLNIPHTHKVQISGDDLNASLKISALRSAIALQKYKEIQESNDSDFASQVLAHFGVKPKHDDYKSYFIGGADSTLDINPQINQNLADGNDPTIKATGAGQLSCSCKFHSDTYGIIIGIYRCVPQLDLAHVGLDRQLFKTDASDFPLPELDNIGMQTQYRCELWQPQIGVAGDKTDYWVHRADYDYSQTYGYLPRYAEYKTSFDRYEGAFLDSLKSWVTGYDESILKTWAQPLPYGTVGDPYQISELLKCRPSIVKNLFVDQLNCCCANDKILVGSVNTCVAVRPFSVYGLPYSK